MIAQQTGGNCLVRGFTTMRLALGYAEAKPEAYKDMEPGEKDVDWVLENALAWFPEHNVLVWCDQTRAVIPCEFDWDAHIVGFSYSIPTDTSEHFVVGVPSLRGDMTSAVAVCVELAKAAR